MDWEWVGVNKWQLMMVGVGILMMVAGVAVLKMEEKGARVEVSESRMDPPRLAGQAVEDYKKKDDVMKVMVEVAGAVEKPGVYEMVLGARVVEALAKAGGMSGKADREWVSVNINQAAEIKDGGKIYIPKGGETPLRQGFEGQATNIKEQTGVNLQTIKEISSKISVNTASQTELETLWGIGSVRALAIIANRPYGSMAEMQTKAKIPNNVMERNKDKISL